MIKAGIVIVNRFCGPSAKEYASYIDYIDRNEAVRNEHLEDYNLFNDYMEHSEKTSGLFTDHRNNLSKEDKRNLKTAFRTAQKNRSLLWQTVISFDNEWLSKHGIYDLETGILDENKMKEISRGAIRNLLESENLQNAVWSASFHYNTDNIHVHVGIVEPIPMRQQKMYIQYQYVGNPEGDYLKLGNGAFVKANNRNMLDRYGIPLPRYDRIPIMENGEPKRKYEYIGRMKESSLKSCKKYVVDQVLDQKENNFLINRIIRDQIVKTKKSLNLAEDYELAKQFIQIYKAMPQDCNRSLWKYNTNIMQPLKGEIDKLSDMYMEKYHAEDIKLLKRMLHEQSEGYKTAYGNTGRNFEENKMKELYERLGNAILTELRDYDQKIKNQGYFEQSNGEGNSSENKTLRTTKWKSGQGYFLTELSRTMQALKRSMENEKEKSLNMKVYYEDERKGNQKDLYELD